MVAPATSLEWVWTALSTANVAALAVDHEDVVRRASAAALLLLGRSISETLRHPLSALLDGTPVVTREAASGAWGRVLVLDEPPPGDRLLAE